MDLIIPAEAADTKIISRLARVKSRRILFEKQLLARVLKQRSTRDSVFGYIAHQRPTEFAVAVTLCDCLITLETTTTFGDRRPLDRFSTI
jgi:hypothetical protein